MRFWILSDLHIEQSKWDIPVPAPDHHVPMAAGDIHTPLSAGVRWLAERADKRPVIYVPGNHEWFAYQQRFTISDEAKRGQELAEALRVPFDGPTVVVTHHLPHPKSIHPHYAGDPLTPAFCSYLSELFENSGAALWAHTHARS